MKNQINIMNLLHLFCPGAALYYYQNCGMQPLAMVCDYLFQWVKLLRARSISFQGSKTPKWVFDR